MKADGTYTGEPESAIRTAAEWLKIQTSPTVNISTSGRIYDSASSNPYFYCCPSLMVNSLGDMVIGFSASKTTEHFGALYTGVRASGAMPVKPILLQPGRRYYAAQRWGDFSYTSLDPDGLTFWTVQEYAEMPDPGESEPVVQYGTWITKIIKNP